MSKLTDEERVAKKLIDLLADIRLDLHLIGYYFANLATLGAFMRLEEVVVSADETRETANDRDKHYAHIVDLGKD